MSAHLSVRNILRECVSYVAEQISAHAFFDRHDAKIRHHPLIAEQIASASDNDSPVTIISIGKMADAMAHEFVTRFGWPNVQGIVSSPYDTEIPAVPGLEYFRGGHPLPNEQSFDAAASAMELLARLSRHDVVIFLISGGGSACFELPAAEIDLQDIRVAYSSLISCGAGIREINSIRQRLSSVKGGRLAAATSAEHKLSLVVSDVKDDEIAFVSSGPSISSRATRISKVHDLVDQLCLNDKLPESAIRILSSGRQASPRVPHGGDSIRIGSNTDAVVAAREQLSSHGWQCKVIQQFDDQPIDSAAAGLLQSLESFRSPEPCCIIAGGEVISPVVGSGQGGRNQAFVLECVPRIAGQRIAVMSFGTDGIDGNSPAAGAIADGRTLSRSNDLGIETQRYAAESNSYGFFAQLGDQIDIGPTQSNVCDVRVLVRF